MCSISRTTWGQIGDVPIYLYTMKNENGLSVSVSNYGATVTHVKVPDRQGKEVDVVLGFDTLEDWQKSDYVGSTIGRVANRVAGAEFDIDDRKYKLESNDGSNLLHGGRTGFHKQVFSAQILPIKHTIGRRKVYQPVGSRGKKSQQSEGDEAGMDRESEEMEAHESVGNEHNEPKRKSKKKGVKRRASGSDETSAIVPDTSKSVPSNNETGLSAPVSLSETADALRAASSPPLPLENGHKRERKKTKRTDSAASSLETPVAVSENVTEPVNVSVPLRISSGLVGVPSVVLASAISGCENKGGDISSDELTDFSSPKAVSVDMRYFTKAGEGGWPGNMLVQVVFSLDKDNKLLIDMRAESDKATLCNLCNHAYWNLNGHNGGDVKNHMLKLNSKYYTPVNEQLVPTGAVDKVKRTIFDFCTRAKLVGRDMVDGSPSSDLKSTGKEEDRPVNGLSRGGYDHNFIINNSWTPNEAAFYYEAATKKGSPRDPIVERLRNRKNWRKSVAETFAKSIPRYIHPRATVGQDLPLRTSKNEKRESQAVLSSADSGIAMKVFTNAPGLQLYTGNFIDGSWKGKGGFLYQKHAAVCLETQTYPDAVHHSHFPSSILRVGEGYRHWVIHQFCFGSTALPPSSLLLGGGGEDDEEDLDVLIDGSAVLQGNLSKVVDLPNKQQKKQKKKVKGKPTDKEEDGDGATEGRGARHRKKKKLFSDMIDTDMVDVVQRDLARQEQISRPSTKSKRLKVTEHTDGDQELQLEQGQSASEGEAFKSTANAAVHSSHKNSAATNGKEEDARKRAAKSTIQLETNNDTKHTDADISCDSRTHSVIPSKANTKSAKDSALDQESENANAAPVIRAARRRSRSKKPLDEDFV